MTAFDEGYAVIPRQLVLNADVSGQAKMVYVVLSVHANQYAQCWPSHETIAAESGFGVATVKRRLAELRDLGLITWQPRSRAKTDEGKTLKPVNVYTLSNSSQRAIAPQSISSEQPTISSQGAIERTSFRTNNRVTTREDEKSDLFDAWWELYPRKVAKPAALKAWKAAVKRGTSERELLDGLARWRRFADVTRPEFIPHPATWLNQERWKDEPLSTTSRTARDSRDAEAARRINERRNNPMAAIL